jgi:hypothetical protein
MQGSTNPLIESYVTRKTIKAVCKNILWQFTVKNMGQQVYVFVRRSEDFSVSEKCTHTYLTSDRTKDPQNEDLETYRMMTGPLNKQ